MKAFTSASAGKFLKTLDEEKRSLLAQEDAVSTYTVGVDEKAEAPEYDYAAVREQIAAIDAKALAIRHALHVFNAQTVLPEHGITIDEALIQLAQLSNEKAAIGYLAGRQPKTRVSSQYRNAIEYCYANYDIDAVKADHQAILGRINALQLELDLVNHTATFEVDL